VPVDPSLALLRVPVVLAAQTPGPFDAFLTQAAVVLLAAAAVGYVCSRIGIVPIVGFLVAGVAIGPNALGLVRDLAVVEVVAEVGIVLLLFTIGIQFSLERLARIRRYVLVGGATKVSLSVLLGVAVLAPFGVGIRDAVFTGFLVAVSSTAIVLKVLAGRGELGAPSGTVAMALLIFDDLASVLMVLLVPILAGGAGGPGDILRVLVTTVALITVVLVGARRVLPKVLDVVARACSPEVFLLTILAISIGTAWLTSLSGVSVSLGAFLAGLLVSESRQSQHALGEVLPLQILFTAAFFLSIGMLLDLRFLLDRPLLVLGAVLLGFLVPLLTTVVATSALRVGTPTVLASSFLLAQVSEFAFVIERAGAAAGLSPAGLGEDGSQAFIAAVVLLMVVTPLSSSLGRRLAAAAAARASARERDAVDTTASSAPDPAAGPRGGAFVSGWGPRARHLGAELAGAGVEVTVVTLNPGGATEAEEAGYRVVLGDSTKRHVLLHAGVADAAVIVVADDGPDAAAQIAGVARDVAPGVPIVVVAGGDLEVSTFAAAGVAHLVAPERATADELTAVVRALTGVGQRDGPAPPATTVLPSRIVDAALPTDRGCTHTDLGVPVLPAAAGCVRCLREGTSWVHLRLCLSCGHVGCCDSSPGRHARAHATAAEHPLVVSAEPADAWAYCFEDDTMLPLRASPVHARDGLANGTSRRVPFRSDGPSEEPAP
jgi:CPA2 family monovalent cation:H+ antiporter-2